MAYRWPISAIFRINVYSKGKGPFTVSIKFSVSISVSMMLIAM